MRIQYASDVGRDIIAGELFTDEDVQVAEVFEVEGVWTLNLFDGSVEPTEFIEKLQAALTWLSAKRD